MGASPAVVVVVVVVLWLAVVVVVVVVVVNDAVCRNRVPAAGLSTSTPGVAFWPRRRSLKS
jgi:mannose/fructose/N-acetylgalactosamine-specific phosphotransferase system component IIB